MKMVTTLITTYNHSEFIAQAIESAVAQQGDFQHEILIADDASTDRTHLIVQEYAKRYPGLIRDISITKNIGISRNMRQCFEAARGDYVAILEGDDYWDREDKLSRQLKFLEENTDCSFVFSRIKMLTDGELSILPRHDHLPSKLGLQDLLAAQDMNPVCNFSCCMFRAKYLRIIPDIAYETRLSEVTVAFFMVLLGKIGYINDSLSVYRIHSNGTFAGATTEQKLRQALATFETVRKIADIGCWDVLTDYIEHIKRCLLNR